MTNHSLEQAEIEELQLQLARQNDEARTEMITAAVERALATQLSRFEARIDSRITREIHASMKQLEFPGRLRVQQSVQRGGIRAGEPSFPAVEGEYL